MLGESRSFACAVILRLYCNGMVNNSSRHVIKHFLGHCIIYIIYILINHDYIKYLQIHLQFTTRPWSCHVMLVLTVSPTGITRLPIEELVRIQFSQGNFKKSSWNLTTLNNNPLGQSWIFLLVENKFIHFILMNFPPLNINHNISLPVRCWPLS